MTSKIAEYPPGHLYELTRPLFFSGLMEVVPEIIDELKQKPLDCYTRYCRAFVDSQTSSPAFDYVSNLYEEYERSLSEWASDHQLDETVWEDNSDWVLMKAREYVEACVDSELMELYEAHNPVKQKLKRLRAAMVEYYGTPNSREYLFGEFTDTDTGRRYVATWPKLIFISDGWNPFEEKRSEAVRKLTDDFTKHLKKYLDEMEATCRKMDISPVPKTLRKRRTVRHRFAWLIRFHVQGWSKNRIAIEYGLKENVLNGKDDRSSVKKSLETESGLIGLLNSSI